MHLRVKASTVSLLAALVLPCVVQAQESPIRGGTLNVYEPTVPGDPFFVVDHPWYSSARRWSAGLTFDYALNPLRYTDPTNGNTTHVVSDMFTGHLGGSVALFDRLGIALSLPVSLLQSGNAVDDGMSTLGPAGGVPLGDLRLTTRVRLLGHADADAFSLHAGAHLWAPFGGRDVNTGDEGFRVEPRAIAAGRVGPLRWSATLGYHFRPVERFSNVAFGDELRLGAALGVVLLGEKLTAGIEGYAVSLVGDPYRQGTFNQGTSGGELIAGAHYRVADRVLLGLGASMGLGSGYGIPAARLLFSAAWAPVLPALPPPLRALDSDGDGVLDPDDGCPTTPQGERPDEAHLGCPLADSDGDGLFDGEDRCLSEPQGARPDPTQPGCPLRDRDSDGVFDPEDQCPTDAMGTTGDPTRRGCPSADRDRDGVADHDDQCPDAPRMPFPDSVRAGCPQPDADNDQVPEPGDACPTQSGVPSLDPRRNGCLNPLLQLTQGEIRLTQPIVFNTGRDKIKRESFATLEAVADVIRGATRVRRVSIEAHTDDRTTPERNITLSERRARAVMRWLIQHGVAAERLEAHGFGQAQPLVPNEGEENRARNRRVEFRIVDPAGPPSASMPAVVAASVPSPPVAAPQEGRDRRRRRRRDR
jgi:outer membrane protein OmpA-like peptidoglycan-associated protein